MLPISHLINISNERIPIHNIMWDVLPIDRQCHTNNRINIIVSSSQIDFDCLLPPTTRLIGLNGCVCIG